MNKNFCYAPFVHMYLHDTYDRKLCCLSNDKYDIEKPISIAMQELLDGDLDWRYESDEDEENK